MASIQIVSGLVLMASTGSMSATQEQQHQALATARDRCHVEIQQLCTGIPTDTLLGCLKAHASRLSPTCQSALADARSRRTAQSAD